MVEKSVDVVLESFECTSRANGVERLAERLGMRDEVRKLSCEYEVHKDSALRRCGDILKENESL